MEAVTRLALITILLIAAAGGRGACAFVHRTIESDDGDVIDCVDIYHQPALKHAPPGSRVIHQQAKPETISASKPHHQTWRKHGSCPAGTVPIRRESSNANPEVAERIRRSSPFGRPNAGSTNKFNLSSTTQFVERRAGTFNQSAMAAPPGGKVEVAAAYATNGPYLGARADVPCWKVDVHPNDFSMSYILVGTTLDTTYRPVPGADPPAHLTNQIAVGLVAWPSLFGDSLSRLFVYYTNDEGVANNCFNLDCGGFHVTSTEFALGSSFGASSYSQIGGDLYGVTLGIHRDSAGMKWWVSVNDQDIGYYPESVFNTRFTDGCYVELGGRVMDSRPGGAHTTTPMGSGIPPCAGWRFAASITRYNGVNSGGALFPDDASKTIATTPSQGRRHVVVPWCPGTRVAAAFATNGPYLGARADVPCWKVDVHPNDFSMGYILVGTTLDTNYRAIRGADPPAHLTNQIAVGLVAWPSLFGDSLSRLFVYYTNDEGVANNCFNLDCGGFHVTSTEFALGSSFGANSNSQIGGDLYGVTFGIHRDIPGMRWWVSVNDRDIGYYPESVFNTRFTDACYVEMGGRVMDSRPGGVHTTTPMGSGIPPCAGWRFAATIMRYNGLSSAGALFNDDASRTIATTPSCYAANPVGFDTSRGGFDIVYGGPGGIHCDQ